MEAHKTQLTLTTILTVIKSNKGALTLNNNAREQSLKIPTFVASCG